MFYDTKFADGLKVTQDILNEIEQIPTGVMLKIKLLENSIGLGNSETFAVKQIINEVNAATGEVSIEKEMAVIGEADIVYPVYECEKIEEVNDFTVRYVFGDKVVTGYKPNEA